MKNLILNTRFLMVNNDDGMSTSDAAKVLGQKGGQKTAQTHGSDFYQKIGQKGGESRGQNQDQNQAGQGGSGSQGGGGMTENH